MPLLGAPGVHFGHFGDSRGASTIFPEGQDGSHDMPLATRLVNVYAANFGCHAIMDIDSSQQSYPAWGELLT